MRLAFRKSPAARFKIGGASRSRDRVLSKDECKNFSQPALKAKIPFYSRSLPWESAPASGI